MCPERWSGAGIGWKRQGNPLKKAGNPMTSRLRMRRSICPLCGTELGPQRFQLKRLWSMAPFTFRCPSCATLLRWNTRQRAFPILCVWGLLFAPPVFLQAYYGSWTNPGYLIIYANISFLLCALSLLAIIMYFPVDAEQVRDE